jgi:hypothetical protein
MVYISSGFNSSEDQLIYPSNLYGVSGSYNQTTGVLTLTGLATTAQYQEILRTIQYNNTNSSYAASTKTVAYALGNALPFTPCGASTPHFYKFISNPGISFTDALAAAASQTYFGLQGYLATILCDAENSFASGSINQAGWIGANDVAQVGSMTWINGPEAGKVFSQGIGNPAPVNGMYNNWNGGEPNNSGGSEFYAQFLPNGKWNDLSNNANVNGYYMEFGGSASDCSYCSSFKYHN